MFLVFKEIKSILLDYLWVLKHSFPPHGFITWGRFRKTNRDKKYIHNPDTYKNTIFVCGCQRSGTTALWKAIVQSDCVETFPTYRDSELDGAAILCGKIHWETKKTACFQVTYIDHNLYELCAVNKSNAIVWVLRNPVDVMMSMLYNWRTSSLVDVYYNLTRKKPSRYRVFFKNYRIHLALTVIKLKMLQCSDFLNKQNPNFIIVRYNDIITNPVYYVQKLCNFCKIEYSDNMACVFRKGTGINAHVDLKENPLIRECLDLYSELSASALK